MKLELLTNAAVVDDAITFVTSNANFSNIHGARIHASKPGQGQVNTVAQTLYSSGILKEGMEMKAKPK